MGGYLFGEEARVDVADADEKVVGHDFDEVGLPTPHIASIINDSNGGLVDRE
jgi:hypothetical protein